MLYHGSPNIILNVMSTIFVVLRHLSIWSADLVYVHVCERDSSGLQMLDL